MRCAKLDWPSKLVEQRVAYVSQATIFCTRLAPGRTSVGRPPKPNKWTHFTELQHASASFTRSVANCQAVAADPPRAVSDSVRACVAALHWETVFKDGATGCSHAEVAPVGPRDDSASSMKAESSTGTLFAGSRACTAHADVLHTAIVKTRKQVPVQIFRGIPRISPCPIGQKFKMPAASILRLSTACSARFPTAGIRVAQIGSSRHDLP